MTVGRWGRFTLRGSEEVESRIESMVTEVAEEVTRAIRPAELEALILLGGYGRGEGGVERRGGRELPHNNLDFLLILRRGSPQEASRHAREAVEPLSLRHELGIDLGAVDSGALRRAPCMVMWADMRGGHKTIAGNPNFVPSLVQFSAERIVPADVRDLLTNRGTLLLINDLLLESREPTAADRRVILKHEMKAIIGYGDALLFFLGDYHWSYAEKQRRMRGRTDVSAAFRALYDEAIEFRFAPDYDSHLARHPQPGERTRALRAELGPIHLACERLRLRRPGLGWRDYPALALRTAALEGVGSVRGLARKARNWLRAGPTPASLGWGVRLGLWTAGIRGVLPILFPAIAYDLQESGYRSLAGEVLGASGEGTAALRRAYLRGWCVHGDPNFPQVLRRLELTLEEPVSLGQGRGGREG